MMESAPNREKSLGGVLLGTAIGDAIGLPRENMSARRAERMFGRPPLKHRFLFGWGMTSDDTEHACMVGQSLRKSGGDPSRFAWAMGWQLRWWLLGLPSGTGLATLKSCIRLWLGWPAGRSGVYSAGNGPAMRSALLGVHAGENVDLLCKLVAASTRLTHSDPRAYEGVLVVALAAALGSRRGPGGVQPNEVRSILLPHLQQPDLRANVEQALAVVAAGLPAAAMPPQIIIPQQGHPPFSMVSPESLAVVDRPQKAAPQQLRLFGRVDRVVLVPVLADQLVPPRVADDHLVDTTLQVAV